MHPTHHLARRRGVSRFILLLASIVGTVAIGGSAGWLVPRAAAAGLPLPRGRWEIQVVVNANDQYLKGPVVYTFGVVLKEGGVGSTTATLDYRGAPITDGLLKGARHVRAVIARPITSATRDGEKLLLFSGGTFKLVSGDPPGHTIKEYATAGGLYPESTIDKLMASFYGVMVFTISGDDLVLVPKDGTGGKKVVWKRVR